MRILHTADWHLGAATGPASRCAEQAWFLDWLLETLAERAVDALVVAGDVFDSMHPSAEALELYYGFLARVGRAGVRDVVIVGGNHDSPSRLDAPRRLLESVAVHVVGGVPAMDDRLGRMVAPLRTRGSEEVAAVCLAVPYVHEYRLGIRTTDLDRERTRAEFRAEFSRLYREIADHAQARFPGAPLIATGHLTLGTGSTRDDYPQEIHQVGTLEGLPAEILDPRIRYTALGHIHRCYPIAGSSAWYSGTPIPYSLTEMSAQRQVLVVDIDGDAEAVVERVDVPRGRDLIELAGRPEEVLSRLASLTWSTRIPPLVFVRVETPEPEPGLARRLHEALADGRKGDGPVLVEVQQRVPAGEGDDTAPAAPSLEELTPEEVFGLLCDRRRIQGESRSHLVAAFNRIAQATRDEDFEAMLAAIDLPPTVPGGAS